MAWNEEEFWLKHDLKMDAMWLRVFGPDEPDDDESIENTVPLVAPQPTRN